MATVESGDQISLWVGTIKSADVTYVAFTSPRWTSIESNRQYSIEIQSPTKTWNGEAIGFDHGDYKGIVFEGVKHEFIEDLMRSSGISLLVSGKFISRLNISDSKVAIEKAIECQHRTLMAGVSRVGKTPTDRESSGTGFFVLLRPGNTQRSAGVGVLLTNYHVVKACPLVLVTQPGSKSYTAQIIAQDEQNDLALVTADLMPKSVPAFRVGARLGENIAVYGFPLTGLLATSGNFTVGTITAMAGLGDDTRFFQISAPIQPGNSGGPVLDRFGNVVGVVVSKLNVLKLAPLTDDVAQNVNFSLKAATVINFLEANDVRPEKAPSSTPINSADSAAAAKSFTAQVICKSTPKTSERESLNTLTRDPLASYSSGLERLFGAER